MHSITSRLRYLPLVIAFAVALTVTGADSTAQVSSSVGGNRSLAGAATSHRVRILGGETYVVPNGTLLIVRTLGHTADNFAPGGGQIELRSGGVTVLNARMPADGSIIELEFGASFSAGEMVEVVDADPFTSAPTVAFGYLTRG
jgi:hypothetical protein